MTTTPKALPALPAAKAWMMEWPQHSPSFTTDKSDYVSWVFGKASYPDGLIDLFTADQMHAYAQQAIADSLASAGGVEVVAWWNTKWSLGATIRELSEHKPDIGPMEETPAYKAGELVALVRQPDHLAALTKEREVADGLAEAMRVLLDYKAESAGDGWLEMTVGAGDYQAAQAALTAHRGSRSEG